MTLAQPWPRPVPDLPEPHANATDDGDAARGGDEWPSSFPSDLVARQAAELRASVVRLASEKLALAEEEAANIRRQALEEASETRRQATQLMVTRLDEAAAAGEAVRDAALGEAVHAREEASVAVEEAAGRVRALHEDIAGVVGRVESLLGWLTSLEDRLAALQERLQPDPPDAAPPAT